MVYVDTSVLVALYTNEPHSARVARWYAANSGPLVSAAWIVTEFASALGIKQRTGQLTAAQSEITWQQFERLCAADLQLAPIEPSTFHHAALLTRDAKSSLRAGDALHLAAALELNVHAIATLDGMLAKAARKMKLSLVKFK